MDIPKRAPVGSLIAYEFLWKSLASSREDGAKVYPVAIIHSFEDLGQLEWVYAVGVSHKPPRPEERAVHFPKKLQRHLGMETEPSWLYTDQVNEFVWPSADIRTGKHFSTLPSARNSCVIGPLPDDWFNDVLIHFAESKRLRLLRLVNREEGERHRGPRMR